MPSKVRIEGVLDLDGRGFKRTLDQSTGQVRQAAQKMAGSLAGAFSLAAISKFVQQTVQAAAQLSTIAKQADITAEQVQVLNFAAARSNVSLQEMVNIFKDLARNREIALGETDEFGRKSSVFAAFAINREQLRGMEDVWEIYRQIQQIVRSGNLGPGKLALLSELSEGLPRALPMLSQNFDELNQSLKDFGLILSDADLERLAKMDGLFKSMAKSAEALAQQKMAGTVRDLEDIAKAAEKIIGKPGFAETARKSAGAVPRALAAAIPGPFGPLMSYAALARQLGDGQEAGTQRGGGMGILSGMTLAALAASEAIKQLAAPSAALAAPALRDRFIPAGDRLARIGGFTGRGNIRAENYQERTARAAEQIVVETKQLNRNVKDFP